MELPPAYLDELNLKVTDVAARDLLGMRVINTVRNRVEKSNAIFGFKDFLFNLRRAKIYNQISNSKNWKKVFLIRNPVERYVSLRRATHTGVFVVKSGHNHDESILNKKITFEEDDFKKFMHSHNNLINESLNLQREHGDEKVFIANYELMPTIAHLQDLLKFIGSAASAGTLVSEHIKQYSSSFSDGIGNWDEFYTYLNNNSMAQYIPNY